MALPIQPKYSVGQNVYKAEGKGTEGMALLPQGRTNRQFNGSRHRLLPRNASIGLRNQWSSALGTATEPFTAVRAQLCEPGTPRRANLCPLLRFM